MSEKKKLPEINIGEGPIVDLAAQLMAIRTQKAQLETKEKELRASIEEHALSIRDEKLTEDTIVGMIRITDDRAPIRVEFKIDGKKAALDLSEEQNLDELFKGSRPLIFGKDTMVTEITGPEELLKAIQESGRNPWDHLKLVVKEGSDEIVSQYPYQVSSTVFMPKEGFLATVSDILRTFSTEALGYIKTYIKEVIKPTVVAGSKGTGK